MKVYNILWLKFLNGSVKNTELGMPFHGVLTPPLSIAHQSTNCKYVGGLSSFKMLLWN